MRPARYLLLFWLLTSLPAHTGPLWLCMASGDILHQNNPNLATSGTSLGFMSAFSMNYAVCSLLFRTEGSILLFPKRRQERRGGIYEGTFKSALPRHRNPVQAELLLSKKLGMLMTTSSLTLKKAKLWERASRDDDCAYYPAELRGLQKGYLSAMSAAFHAQQCW